MKDRLRGYTIFSLIFRFSCAFFLRAKKFLAYCAHDDTPRALPDLDTLNTEALKALILTQRERIVSKDAQLLLKDEQLELRLDELEASRAENTAPSQASAVVTPDGKAAKPARRPLPEYLPLYRQSEMYAREGVELDRSTLADGVGGTSRLLQSTTTPPSARWRQAGI